MTSPRRLAVAHDPQSADAETLARSTVDPGAFPSLVERHGDRLYDYLVRRVGTEAAEDLTCDLWERAFEGRAGYDTARGSVTAWLYGHARLLVQEHWRARRRSSVAHARAGAMRTHVALPDEQCLDAIDSTQVSARVLDALQQLDEDEQELFELWVWDELSYAEISQVLQVPIGTVRSRLARAREKLARCAGL